LNQIHRLGPGKVNRLESERTVSHKSPLRRATRRNGTENRMTQMAENVQIRIHGPATLPALIYLPDLHGNWKLLGGFRRALAERVRLVEVSYPSTLTWSLADHAAAVERALAEHGIAEGWLLGES